MMWKILSCGLLLCLGACSNIDPRCPIKYADDKFPPPYANVCDIKGMENECTCNGEPMIQPN